MVDSRGAYAVNVEAVDAQGTTQCSRQASLTVNARTGPEWKTIPTLARPEDDPNLYLWGEMPEVVPVSPLLGGGTMAVGVVGKEFDRSSWRPVTMQPQAIATDALPLQRWAGATEEGTVSDPSGPNDAFVFVKKANIRVEHAYVVNFWLRQDGAKPDPVFSPQTANFWDQNQQMCEPTNGFSPGEYVAAIAGHENDGAWEPGTGHFGVIARLLAERDPRKIVEAEFDSNSTDFLRLMVALNLSRLENDFNDRASDDGPWVKPAWPPPPDASRLCNPGPCDLTRASFWRSTTAYAPECGTRLGLGY
ncbi:MAG: hypothetical protein HY904_06555, partial [Deltaproteobacteria bacterium]|nr:hypothetical protein [Deltaproteobacteria bacterium]